MILILNRLELIEIDVKGEYNWFLVINVDVRLKLTVFLPIMPAVILDLYRVLEGHYYH